VNHRDALISEVVVVFDETPENPLATIINGLVAAGLQVEDTDPDNGTVDGTIDSNKLPELRAVPGVKYVRITMEYVADFPIGDPRDLDKTEDE
jgi:hypothetical protein